MRELTDNEAHPCKCDDRHVVLSNEDFDHIKRDYYEATRYFFCRRCDCSWKKVTWCVGQHSRIIIQEEPGAEEE